jgi:hypothetical protein
MGQINNILGNTLLESGAFPPCRVATTGTNITLIGLQTIDGTTLLAGDRVLVKDQTAPTQNGIYAASSANWVRTSDALSNTHFFQGMVVAVAQGTLNARTLWMCNCADDPVIIGTSRITFVTSGLSFAPLPGATSATAFPVINPSSGNFQGAGNPVNPQYLRSDENAQINADVIQLFSGDPSAGGSLTIGGSVTTGDTVTVHFLYGTKDIAVSYTAQSGDTLASVAAGLVAAVKANSTLFTPVNATNRVGGGGYDLGGQIGFIISGGAQISFDYNTLNAMSVKYSVSGAATETLTVGAGFLGNAYQAGGSTVNTTYALPNAWDNNPAIVFGRQVAGQAPPAGSQIAVIYATGADSSSSPLGTRNVNYGDIAFYVGDSTHGHLQGAWIIQAVGGGSFSNGGGGTWFGQGCYSNYGGAPFQGGVVDQGPGTFNAGVGYFFNNVYSITKNGSALAISTLATNDPISISANAGAIALTSSGGISAVGTVASNSVMKVTNLSATAPEVMILQNQNAVGSSGNYLLIGKDSGGDHVYIYGNGNIQNTNNSYGAISDREVKTDITDAPGFFDKLMKVRVRSYRLKKDPDEIRIGVVAQEMEDIFPDLVTTGVNGLKAFNYAGLVPPLVKAFQELAARLPPG